MLLLFLLFGLQFAYGQEVKINEMMASNANTIEDEDGDSADWIELFNGGQTSVNLSGFGLSDNTGKPFKWVFPEVSLEPGAFLLVWASGKDRADPASPLHTSFSIKAEGEELLLTKPDGERVDEIAPLAIATDFSYGRKADGTGQFYFFSEPTPGTTNNEAAAQGELTEVPVFSHEGGFYASAFELTLSSSEAGTTIIYTTDGSTPDPENLSGTTFTYKNQYPESPGDPFGELISASFKSQEYSGPIMIRDRATEEDFFTQIATTRYLNPWYMPDQPVFKGTVIKARAIKEDALPSEVVAHTYYISEETHSRYSIPVVSLSVQGDALFDYEKGIYVAGKEFDDWRSNNPNAPSDDGKPANYHRSGSEWEYPAYIEVFDGEKGRVLSQNLGIRIHGGWSTGHAAKSIRLYARNEYGPSHFNYAFFPDQQDSTYKRLILRNSGNDYGYTLFRDAAMQAMVKHLNFETQAYQPAVLFINSEYWGIHNFRERYDQHYFARIYDIDSDKVDILEGGGWVDEGSATHYRETLDYIERNGLREDAHYQYIQTRIDVESFIDYQLAEIFFGNGDWPGNNIKFWRYQTDQYLKDAPKGLDGRWRWMMYDTDFGFGLYGRPAEENMLRLAADPNGPGWPNPPWSTFLLRSLLENQSFRQDFINRFADQLNTALLPEVMKAQINKMKMVIEPEIAEHVQRWGLPGDMGSWISQVDQMLDFADKRPAHQRRHLRDYFDLAGDYRLEVNISHANRGHVKINSLELAEGTVGLSGGIYPWTGTYFRGVPVELEAVAAPGFAFVGWEGDETSSLNKITLQPNGNTAVKAVFKSITSGIEQEGKDFSIRCYPNPFEQGTKVKITLEHQKQVKISLRDLTGKLYAEIPEQLLAPGDHFFDVQSSQLSPGVYMINCQVDGQQNHYKLVKY